MLFRTSGDTRVRVGDGFRSVGSVDLSEAGVILDQVQLRLIPLMAKPRRGCLGQLSVRGSEIRDIPFTKKET